MEANQTIRRTDYRIAIIGLGYVGLPLAIAFAKAGRNVVGLDLDTRKVSLLMAGQSYIPDVATLDVADVIASCNFRATGDYDMLRDRDAIFICVPTPYDAMRAPDLSYIISAAEGIQPRLSAGQIVVLQSTTYPGTTEEVVLPILERGGLKAGTNFDLAFSPERIDPGRQDFTVKNTPKVVGGLTPRATERAAELLGALGAPVHLVSSPRAAEMTKLLENIFRSVNIAMVNELARLCERMGFTPGAGVGGHCIGVDPYYLSWKAREYDFYTRFIELAAEVNQSMPFHVVELAERALGEIACSLKHSKVLILGVAFKRDVDDARNSPAERVMELLMSRGAEVMYHDPYVARFHIGGDVFKKETTSLVSQPLTENLVKTVDCIIIVTGHRSIDYSFIVKNARAVVDCCNATDGIPEHKSKVIRLGNGA
jgi:UDP-N-acetyl-D-glucosamine dehydrogenase